MFNKDYILKELRNGRDYVEIMDEISNVLNEASAEFEKEEKARRNKKQNKIEAMQEIIDLIHDYCIEFYGKTNEDIDKIDTAFENEDAEKYVDLIDSCLEFADSLTELGKMFKPTMSKPIEEVKPDPKANIEVEVGFDADKILSDFLKMFK